ncbi:FTR1 family iron permease [Aristaeella hokkaidonensis]|uniref:FTR1 family iron permease n=1 Tax=Aristaeella hokkaidonensis TaxID=3046382 RepID=A0AC61N6G1_9FIRM|nr:FTR1 family protein [Aristaeella hokkaidonensis]QUC66071.1 FTR1 family iron permease [Aristaeella hokkaidonensis]SNT93698.1 high-affinity iron transporter [Aristaeella hokkaidonensis]
MKRVLRPVLWLVLMLFLAAQVIPAVGEGTSTRWADASDEIDKYLDTAFEDYLAGDTGTAYNNVNDAYFRVYETTGFERQTMSYISGVRKNAVEMQFSACKAAVKKENTDQETIVSVRSALFKLKAMIREDGNKLAAQQGGVQSENKFYKNGELVSADPYPEYSPDPNAAAKYASWYEAASLTKELLDTAYLAYLDKDFEAADDNLNTAYYSVYEESGLSHKIYTELGVKDRRETEKQFTELRNLVSSGEEKYQKNKYRTTSDKTKQVLLKKAKTLDELAAAEKGPAEPAAEEIAAETAEADQNSPQWLTFLGAFGIIVREGLEAILVIAAIIAYLVKSGNGRSLKNVYIGALAGILASFAAAAVLYFVKQAVAGAGMAQELIEGITALIAVCVLFYVSNWMISKAEAAAWTGYIDSKVRSGVEKRSAFTLAFTAFLSVFREGAEVVLFYQPMLQEGNAGMVWAGFGAGVVILVFVYLAITKLSIKLPIKVFFTATSILMAVMCVSFLGSGIKELAEGNLFDLTLRVPGIPENDVIQIFGIYPYLETLVPQLILAVILLITFMVAHYRGRLEAQRKELTAAH